MHSFMLDQFFFFGRACLIWISSHIFFHQGVDVFIIIVGGSIYVLVIGRSCCWCFLFIIIVDEAHYCDWCSGVLILLLDVIYMVIVKVILIAFIFSAPIVALIFTALIISVCVALFTLTIFSSTVIVFIIFIIVIVVHSCVILEVADVGVSHSCGWRRIIIYRRWVIVVVIYVILLNIHESVCGVVLVSIRDFKEGSSVAVTNVESTGVALRQAVYPIK